MRGVRLPTDKRIWLRWAFQALGVLLIFAPGFAARDVVRAEAWAGWWFPADEQGRFWFSLGADIYILVSGLLCLAAGWAFKRSTRWSRPAGILASVVLMAGFPWLTMAGVTALWALMTGPSAPGPNGSPHAARGCRDYWTAKRQSFAQPVISSLLLAVGFGFADWLGIYAKKAGLPAIPPGSEWWGLMFASFLAQTALHELGHAAAAWALDLRIKVISIGPFLAARNRRGVHFRFEWKRLLACGGYTGAVPRSDEGLRGKQIAAVAAGPAASLITGLILLAAFFEAVSLHRQGPWRILAFNAMLGIYYGVANLLPIGYSDGTMLFHLVLGTGRGRQLQELAVVNRLQEEADACHDGACFEQEVVKRQEALRRAESAGDDNTLAPAFCHRALGDALLSAEHWHLAEKEFRRCLAFEAECAAHPAMAALAWSGLHQACVERGQARQATEAYRSAVSLLRELKKNPGGTETALISAMLAESHERAGNWEDGLEEAAGALRKIPERPGQLLLSARLHAAAAKCELRAGAVDRGLAAARRAADLLRSDSIPEARRNLAWQELGVLGAALCRWGQPAIGLALMREAGEKLAGAEAAAAAAARLQIRLASALRQLGRFEEALRALPDDGASAVTRKPLLRERAQLRLSTGRGALALPDCQDLLDAWLAEGEQAAPETAVAKSLLAMACLETQAYEQAEALAAKASELLCAWGHPAAAGCIVTQALARWRRAGLWPTDCAGYAAWLIDSNPFLTDLDRHRIREDESARLKRHGRFWEAEQLRGFAARPSRAIHAPQPQAVLIG